MALRVKEISARLGWEGGLFNSFYVVVSFEGKERLTTRRTPLTGPTGRVANWNDELLVFPLREPLQTSGTQSLKLDLYQQLTETERKEFVGTGTLDISLGLLINGRYQSSPLSLKNKEGESLDSESTVSVTVEYDDPTSSPAEEIHDEREQPQQGRVQPLNRSLTLGEVRAVLWDTRVNWFNLGLALGLPPGTLEHIRNDHHTTEGRLTAMLEAWLQSSPNPTWSELVKALRLPIIALSDIAAEIEDKYIKSDDSSVQESKDTAGEYSVTNGSDYNYSGNV